MSQTQDPNVIYDPNAVSPLVNNEVKYKALGSDSEVKLKVGMVRRYLCEPSRTGIYPNDDDIVKFMMLCQARELDPWVGDAYLIGYDVGEGRAKFSLVTGIQALLKRADLTRGYMGHAAGIVVHRGSAESGEAIIEHRVGTILLQGEVLLGGWATVNREGRSFERLEAAIGVYKKNNKRWNTDPCGMIRKCALAAALREAFPNQLGTLYVEEEFGGGGRGAPQKPDDEPEKPSKPIPPGQPEQIKIDTLIDGEDKAPSQGGSPDGSAIDDQGSDDAIEAEFTLANDPPAETESPPERAPEAESSAAGSPGGSGSSDEYWSAWKVPNTNGGQGLEPDEFIDDGALAYLKDCTTIKSVDDWERRCKEIGMQGEAVSFFADASRNDMRSKRLARQPEAANQS